MIYELQNVESFELPHKDFIRMQRGIKQFRISAFSVVCAAGAVRVRE